MSNQFLSEHKWSTLIVAVALVVGFSLAYRYARPGVPSEVVMSTGAVGGAYDAYAARYQAALAEEGIKLTLRPSRGATENLARLIDEKSGVDIAFVQNGLIAREDAEKKPLESLGSFFYEPVLLFYRPTSFVAPLTSLGDLREKKVAIGAQGSGTRALAVNLLALHDLPQSSRTLTVDVGGEDAAAALRNGSVDAAIFVGSVDAPLIQSLFRDDKLRIADLEYAEAYMRRLSQLTAITLPPGVIDLSLRIPSQAVRTVATTSSLVAREDLHPGVTFLLMRAAKRVHSGASATAKANEFPTFAYAQDFLLSSDAERFLKEGTPLLYRYLPFKVANFVSRAVVFLIPLLAILFSLSDWIPKLIGMQVRNKLFAFYKDVKRIDASVRGATESSSLVEAARELDEIDALVSRIKIPNNYSNDQFGIRDHIDLVRVRIERKRAALSSA